MNDRVLNEKESLELIAQMIQNTKSRMTRNSGAPFLIWGYTTIIVSLLVWFLLKETGNYHWPYCRICMGGIRIRGLFCFLGFHLLLEYVCPFCHIADDGNGDGTDGTDYKDEGGDSVRSGGSFGLCGVYLCTRFRPNTGFCIGFCFYDGDTGTLLKRNGKAG